MPAKKVEGVTEADVEAMIPEGHRQFVKDTLADGSRLSVYVEANETALPRVLEQASARGTTIQRIAYSRPGLDEVFLKYTGHRIDEEAQRV